jgi:hypothetical protein
MKYRNSGKQKADSVRTALTNLNRLTKKNRLKLLKSETRGQVCSPPYRNKNDYERLVTL